MTDQRTQNALVNLREKRQREQAVRVINLGTGYGSDDVWLALDYIATLEEQVEQLQSENASAWLAEMDKRLRDQDDTLAIGERIAQFETQYAMSSADFMRSWLAGDLADTFEFNYWSVLVEFLAQPQPQSRTQRGIS